MNRGNLPDFFHGSSNQNVRGRHFLEVNTIFDDPNQIRGSNDGDRRVSARRLDSHQMDSMEQSLRNAHKHFSSSSSSHSTNSDQNLQSHDPVFESTVSRVPWYKPTRNMTNSALRSILLHGQVSSSESSSDSSSESSFSSSSSHHSSSSSQNNNSATSESSNSSFNNRNRRDLDRSGSF